MAVTSVAADSVSNLYVADSTNHIIRKITPTGVVTTFAGMAGVLGSSDGLGGAARFVYPAGCRCRPRQQRVRGCGNDSTLRKITPAGVVTTVAGHALQEGSIDGGAATARFNIPNNVSLDSAGNLFIADTNNSTIRVLSSAGIVTTLAGQSTQRGSTDGTGSAALFSFPIGVAVDAAGAVFVTDSLNNTIRKITPAGVVTTFAGVAVSGQRRRDRQQRAFQQSPRDYGGHSGESFRRRLWQCDDP